MYDQYNTTEADSVKFKNAEKSIGTKNMYTETAKHISQFGSIRLIDAVTEDDIYSEVKKYMKGYIEAGR